MTEQNQDLPIPSVDDNEGKRRSTSAVLTMVEKIRLAEREKHDLELVEALKVLTEPEREGVPSLHEFKHEDKHPIRTSSPSDPLYRSLPEDVREWRNPDSDHYMAEWIRGMTNKDRVRMLEAEAKLEQMYPHERAAVLEGTAPGTGGVADGSGGELLPRPLQNVVMISRDKVAKMRRFATTYQMTSQETNIPTVANMSAVMIAEATELTQGEPAVAQVPLIAHVNGVQARASKELIEDSAFNLVSILADRGGKAIGVREDLEFLQTGTGTAPHVTDVLGTAYVQTAGTTLSYTDMLGMYYTCPQQYRINAGWYVASDVLQLLCNVRDGMGRPIYQGLMDTPAALTDDPWAAGTILRKPCYEMELTPGTIYFGDMSQYAIGQRGGISIEVDASVLFLTRQVCWMIYERIAGNNTDIAALQYTTGITSATSL